MAETSRAKTEDLPLVSVLFLTYKRFGMLQRSVEQFLAHTEYPNLELVIADDGSGTAIQEQIRTLPAHVFALAGQNRGLGANFNQGLACCRGKYILVIQDDCVCKGPPEYLVQAVRVFEANPTLGLINFAGAAHPPDLSRPLEGSDEPCYLTPEPLQGPIRFFLYTDQPHLQSRAAIDFVGPYLESRDMEECEVDYNHRWENQTRFTTAVLPAYYLEAFAHEGEQHSYRTTRMRYKVHKALLPAKPLLQRLAPGVFKAARSSVERTLRFLERHGVIR